MGGGEVRARGCGGVLRGKGWVVGGEMGRGGDWGRRRGLCRRQGRCGVRGLGEVCEGGRGARCDRWGDGGFVG